MVKDTQHKLIYFHEIILLVNPLLLLPFQIYFLATYFSLIKIYPD